MDHVLLQPEQHLVCPNCTVTEVRHDPPSRPGETAGRFHACAGLRGLQAPLILDGVRCRVFAVEREDYVAGALVQTDEDGRPFMAVRTVRDDGEDCAVLAPTAQATMDVFA